MSYTTVQNPGSPTSSWDSVLNSFLGLFTWDAVGSFPAMSIQLFIKDHPIPMRKPKFSEINTITQPSLNGGYETGFSGIFQGASEPLQVAIQGWMITPIASQQWAPLNSSGAAATAFGNRSYPEIVSGYLAGDWNMSAGGCKNRLDPTSYVTPYGHKYVKPLVYSWDWGLTTNMRKQTFSATLFLER